MSYEIIAAALIELPDNYSPTETVNVRIARVTDTTECVLGTEKKCYRVTVDTDDTDDTDDTSDATKRLVLTKSLENLFEGKLVYSYSRESSLTGSKRPRFFVPFNNRKKTPTSALVAAEKVDVIVDRLRKLGKVKVVTPVRQRWGSFDETVVELVVDGKSEYGKIDRNARVVVVNETDAVRKVAEECEKHATEFFKFILNEKGDFAEKFRNVVPSAILRKHEYSSEDLRLLFPDKCEVGAFVCTMFLRERGFECDIVTSLFEPGEGFDATPHALDDGGRVKHAHLIVEVHGVRWYVDPLARGFGTDGPEFWNVREKEYRDGKGVLLGTMTRTSGPDSEDAVERDYAAQYHSTRNATIVGMDQNDSNTLFELYLAFLSEER